MQESVGVCVRQEPSESKDAGRKGVWRISGLREGWYLTFRKQGYRMQGVKRLQQADKGEALASGEIASGLAGGVANRTADFLWCFLFLP